MKLCLLLLCIVQISLAQIRVATASNFYRPLKKMAVVFEEQHGIKVLISSGSSGKLYSQINNGAPFDVFLSADTLMPYLLEKSGTAVIGSRMTYATGRLLLWAPGVKGVNTITALFADENLKHIALANPKLAPYGVASKEFLLKRNQWEALQSKFVFGENVGQTLQFIQSGNCDFGFISYGQWLAIEHRKAGFHYLLESNEHRPIIQQLVRLNQKKESHLFATFLKSVSAKSIIQEYGYEVN